MVDNTNMSLTWLQLIHTDLKTLGKEIGSAIATAIKEVMMKVSADIVNAIKQNTEYTLKTGIGPGRSTLKTELLGGRTKGYTNADVFNAINTITGNNKTSIEEGDESETNNTTNSNLFQNTSSPSATFTSIINSEKLADLKLNFTSVFDGISKSNFWDKAKAFGSVASDSLKSAGKEIAKNPIAAQIGSMSKSMVVAAVAMAPVQAFLEGILEPLDLIVEPFGAMGEILGTAFVPALEPINKLLMQGVTFLADNIGPITDFVTVLSQLTSPLLFITSLVFDADSQLESIGTFSTGLVSGLITKIGNIDWAKAISDFGTSLMSSSFVSSILMGITGTDFSTFGTVFGNIVGSIVSGIANADWAQCASTFTLIALKISVGVAQASANVGVSFWEALLGSKPEPIPDQNNPNDNNWNNSTGGTGSTGNISIGGPQV